MNFTAVVPTSTAIFLSLFAAFLWGTWFISLKYLGDYPVDGFYMTLFTTSIIFVWGLGFLLDGKALLENIRSTLLEDPSIVTVSLGCGGLYVIGIRISLIALQRIGFSLSQPIQASFNILLGTLISGLIGGIPANVNPVEVVLACLLLFAAVFVSMIAGNLRSKELRAGAATSSLRKFSSRDLWRSMVLLVLSSAFIQAYTFGLSYGLRTISHPKGLAVMPFMALLSSGAFIGALFTSGLILTIKQQWKLVWCAPFSIHKFGILSGLFHYGGNIIHTIGTTALSSVISWPLGVTMGLWTQFWGLMYGEFKGASRRTYAALFAGIALYLIGTYLVGIQGQ
jgi:hypothetical protein